MIRLEDLLHAGADLWQTGTAQQFHDFSYDSRQTRHGELFLALRTPRGDGHDHIAAALAAGASGVVCTAPPDQAGEASVLLTDSAEALVQCWASRRLHQVAPRVIAVAGSVGKTSTKHALAHLLAEDAPTFATRASFNSLLGLPVALAHLEAQHRFAVLECGTSRFGELAQLAELFTPEIALVTTVGEAYLNAFGSLAGVAREQATLLAALPRTGWALLNGDDPYTPMLAAQTDARVLTFGQQPGCDLRASAVQLGREQTTLRLHWRGAAGVAAPAGELVVTLRLLGEPAVTIALGAVCAALVCGLSLEAAGQRLAQVPPLSGRLRLLPGRAGALLLDDSYSASLPSLRAALHTLAALPAQRRVLLLGDLADLGEHAAATYRTIGELAGQVADWLVCKGDGGQTVVQAARQSTRPLHTAVVHTTAAALQALPADLGPGDLVLVKGSAAARMEQSAAALLGPTLRAADVLVRQDPGWSAVRIGEPQRPTWIRIDLDALAHNIRRLRALAGVPLMMVLKADAYGHGAVRAARTALANGASALAVATLGEARTLRDADITAPILVLGYTPPWQAHDAVQLGVTCTVFDIEIARTLAQEAQALQRQASVHVKVDTGMTRLGLPPEQVVPFLRALGDLPALTVEGLFTHFATADSADEHFAQVQQQRFAAVLAAVEAAGLRPSLVHAANSAALLRFPAARYDMVRPGIACYGLAPAAETPLPPDLRPVLAFYSEIAQVRQVPAGTPVSYGCTFVTERPSTIATIPVGYADGLRRAPPWREVLVRGQRAPIVGRICMDYAMLDVSHIHGVKRGDVVVLIGTQGGQTITADEVGSWLGTLNYEVVSTLLPRVPREVGG